MLERPYPIFDGPNKLDLTKSLLEENKKVEFTINHEADPKKIEVMILGMSAKVSTAAKKVSKEVWYISFLYKGNVYNRCCYNTETKRGNMTVIL